MLVNEDTILANKNDRKIKIVVPINSTTLVTCSSSIPVNAVEFKVKPLNPRSISTVRISYQTNAYH